MTDRQQMTPDEFRTQLAGLLQLAEDQGGQISTEEVRSFFGEGTLTEEQLQLVYEFLLARKIPVQGSRPAADAAYPGSESGEEQNPSSPENLREEEKRWYDLYREELDGIRPAADGEWDQLLISLRQSERKAAERLTELLLPDVLGEAECLSRGQILLQDLVQEGNLQLLLAREAMDWGMTLSMENARKKLLDAAVAGMRALAAEQEEIHIQNRKMVEKAENLKDGITVLKEEVGRKVYLDEVADFLNLSEEEAEDILRLTGDTPSDESDEE